MTQLSIIIPVLNEAREIVSRLQFLQSLVRNRGIEIIVVDGGSQDDTVQLATAYADKVVSSPRGRAAQMNTGAELASSDTLLFLHLDTQLPSDAFQFLEADFYWGTYKVRLSGKAFFFRVIEKMMNLRFSLTFVSTGDQCLFIKRSLFDQLNGFADIPLMEDVEMTKRLRAYHSPMIIHSPVLTSSRRWEKDGVFSTVVLMWYLRCLYFFGVSPNQLVKKYYK